MNVKKVSLLYFSPTEKTKSVCESIAEVFGKDVEVYDRTDFNLRWKEAKFTSEDLVIIGVPSYYGRAPQIMNEFFRYVEGNNTPAIFVATYGNREYEDTLLELKNESKKRGFVGIGAGAFVGKHSLNPNIATNRPDDKDIELIKDFANKVKSRLEEIESLDNISLEVSGNYPYKHIKEIPVAPFTNENCGNCMICEKNCPMGAISPYDPKVVDGFRCINCGRCIDICQNNAKYIGIEKIKESLAILEVITAQRKEPETFII